MTLLEAQYAFLALAMLGMLALGVHIGRITRLWEDRRAPSVTIGELDLQDMQYRRRVLWEDGNRFQCAGCMRNWYSRDYATVREVAVALDEHEKTGDDHRVYAVSMHDSEIDFHAWLWRRIGETRVTRADLPAFLFA